MHLKKCKFVKSNGKLCQAKPIKGYSLCFRHNPLFLEASIVASQKGGQNRALQGQYGSEVILNSTSDVEKFIGVVINGVWIGKVPVPTGTAMGFLTKCWLEAHNSNELDKRVKSLEERIEKVK